MFRYTQPKQQMESRVENLQFCYCVDENKVLILTKTQYTEKSHLMGMNHF